MNKEFVRKNRSRGYSGWVEIDGDRFYCRSSVEFIYIHHLLSIYSKQDGYSIKMENMIFEYKNEKYKPDFVIYNNNILVKIIETKSDKNQIKRENKENKYEIFKDYFSKIKIDFEICYKDPKILTNEIDKKLEIWKKETSSASMNGENNPMFGMKHSDESKRKIGLKTMERCESPKYLDFLKSKMKKSDDQRENCRISAIRRREGEKIKNDIDRLEKYGQIVSKMCVICGSIFTDREKNTKETCKNSCTFKLRYSRGEIKIGGDGFKSFKTRIIKYLHPFKDVINKMNTSDFDLFVVSLKKSGIIPTTFGISSNTIAKYFDSLEGLKKELDYENN